MPSPFPGMDPYLESPSFWGELHSSLITALYLDLNARLPDDREVVPVLLDKVLPVHQVVPVDFYLPGCPPPAARIRAVLQSLLEGKAPALDAGERSFG